MSVDNVPYPSGTLFLAYDENDNCLGGGCYTCGLTLTKTGDVAPAPVRPVPAAEYSQNYFSNASDFSYTSDNLPAR